MRAVVVDEYGGPEAVEVREVDEPKVGPDSVLVRVHAASLNPVDLKVVEGALDGAFPAIFPLVPGWDLAGEVVAAGPAVSHVGEGQRVYAYVREDYLGGGSWAEYTAVNRRAVAPAPPALDAREASCLPLAGLTAYQALVEELDVGAGDTLLLHAATGGVGTLATQIAVARGARVIGTCSESSHPYLASLGGEPVAYGQGLEERVRALAPDGVDAVLDLAGPQALAASRDLLRRPGRVVSVLDPAGAAELGGAYVFVRPEVAHLETLTAMVEAGELAPRIQSVHDLDDVRDAMREAAGSVQGKVVLRVP